ncbi:LysE family transporter [Sedimentibacter sp. zth1]|uniref:LysE/ArgO family amino acid transporter n=1 Tax=Sedimentibacter sp. zth1 TaxID=2816908 RepID=UPI001A928756|nr:LysE family transporter [Sedimentibacter sp. zth1]QSX07307.1 LysE family transporter [Sedimentibacter sp. zth1]
MNYFFQGLTIGLAYVAPIGAQNLFVIETALQQSKKRSLITAFIVIFFDITLALACFFGIGSLMDKFQILKMIILLVGSVFLIYLGSKLIISKINTNEKVDTNVSITKIIGTSCIVTWFNPQALIDGTILFGAFRATLSPSNLTSFILGSSSASFIWFLGISLIIGTFKNIFNDKILRVVNIICGSIIVLYGIKLMYSFIVQVI